MLVQFFNPQDIDLFLMFLALIIAAIIYSVRLISTLFGGTPERTYFLLWFPIFWTTELCIVHPPKYYSKGCLITLFALWCFSLLCAIIQGKVSSKRTWRQLLEGEMEKTIILIDDCRKILYLIENHRKKLSLRVWGLLFALCLMAMGIAAWRYPPSIYGFFLLYWTISLLFLFIKCMKSCKLLVLFWFSHILIAATAICVALMDLMPANTNDLVGYTLFCFILSVFWCLSAGIAEYDVAKMAGAIVNTITTILLLDVNVILGWLQQDTLFLSSGFSDNTIFTVNLIIFPIVAAGYLSMLYVDGVQYCRKKFAQNQEPNKENE